MSIIDDITGKTQADAAVEAAQIQADAATAAAGQSAATAAERLAATEAATQQQRQDLQPFAQFGSGFIPQAQQAVAQQQQLFSNPTAVLDNPFLQALQNQAQTNILQNQAVRGRLGTGETPEFLESARLRTGIDFLNRERQAGAQNIGLLQSLIGQGQNAAAGQAASTGQGAAAGTNIATGATNVQNQLLTDAAGATAGGVIGEANAQAAGTGNLLSLGTGLLTGGLNFGSPTTGGLTGSGAGTGTGFGSTINSPFAFGG